MTATAAFLDLEQQVHLLQLSKKFHLHPNLLASQEMVSTQCQNTGSSASILGIALMMADWMGEQQWS